MHPSVCKCRSVNKGVQHRFQGWVQKTSLFTFYLPAQSCTVSPERRPESGRSHISSRSPQNLSAPHPPRPALLSALNHTRARSPATPQQSLISRNSHCGHTLKCPGQSPAALLHQVQKQMEQMVIWFLANWRCDDGVVRTYFMDPGLCVDSLLDLLFFTL